MTVIVAYGWLMSADVADACRLGELYEEDLHGRGTLCIRSDGYVTHNDYFVYFEHTCTTLIWCKTGGKGGHGNEYEGGIDDLDDPDDETIAEAVKLLEDRGVDFNDESAYIRRGWFTYMYTH